MLAFMLAINLYSMIIYSNLPSNTVGIIGGADGPTAIYLARQFPSGGTFAVVAVALLLLIVGLVYKKARRKAK